MDIDLLSKMVKELILDNDRVVLPGFGCFVAEIVPASFSDKGYTINPPYRRLYFRAKPDEGNLLVDFYVKSNNVDYALAEKIIGDFLAELKSVIFTRKVVVFPGLGRLRATKENNLFFVADEDLDIYPEGFGLESISLKTHQESRSEVRAAVADLKNILEEKPAAHAVAPEQEQELAPEQGPAPDLEPAPAPEEEPATDEGPVSEGEPATEPEELDSDPEPEPIFEPVAAEPMSEKKTGRKLLKFVGVCVAVAAVLLVAYVAIGRLCPEWVDRFLYTPEELEILNR